MKKVNLKNLKEITDKLVDLVLKDKDKYFCQKFDGFLNELLDNDFFGTEGQCDPRGDRRN